MTTITSRWVASAHPYHMLHVGLVSELHDSIGTAEGRCLRCGASFYVAAPDGRSADEALSALFDKHLAEKHAEEEKADVSCTFAIADYGPE